MLLLLELLSILIIAYQPDIPTSVQRKFTIEFLIYSGFTSLPHYFLRREVQKNIYAIRVGYGKIRTEPTKNYLIFTKKESQYTAILRYTGTFATFTITHFRLVEAMRDSSKMRIFNLCKVRHLVESAFSSCSLALLLVERSARF